MAKATAGGNFLRTDRKKRPGVHAKTKISVHKTGKNYKKPYVGQGK